MDEDNKINPKVSGYLEKKGKMKMMSSYKKYWFVLEGRLLLYYRSKDEYEAISPCKGSISLGPPCNVKPLSSTHGVFQIETRTNTITLRAENQDDQNRWMLGIISALNQNKNSSKLGHFRYSLNELSQESDIKGKLMHPKSILSADSPENHLNKEIIQRLQKIGAQTYGGSMGAINQIANNKKSEISNSNESLQYTMNLIKYENDTLGNEEYSVPNNDAIPEAVDLRNDRMYSENIYERISRCSTESTNGSDDICHYTSHKKTEKGEKHKLPNTPTANENMLLRKLQQEGEVLNRPSTFLLENEVYDISRINIESKNRNPRNIRDSSSEGTTGRPTTFLLENEVYTAVKNITTQKDKETTGRKTSAKLEKHSHTADKLSNSFSESVYNEPKRPDLIDHNENNIILNNGQQEASEEENAYSVIKLYDTSKNIATNNSTNEYEDLDIVEYAELKDLENENTSNNHPEKGKTKRKNKKIKKSKENKTDIDRKEMKLKKTPSFIKRVWKRKPKHKETSDDDHVYETVPVAFVEKMCMTDDTAIQMLSELHNILENKKPILSKQLSTESDPSKYTNQKIQEKNITSGNTYDSTTNNEHAVQMLTELQNILENKKNILTAQISTDKEERKLGAENENHTNNCKDASCSSGSEKIRPLIPPKSQKTNVDSPYHDFPKNNQPINTLPPKKKHNLINIRSLDEILDDLEKEENSNQNSVKKLIKRFSDIDFSEDDVVMRNNKRTNNYSREDVDSDELSRLLEELAKVTCAPILTPGVTTSLINPNLTDEELLNLIPKHRRRHSEPDYDIPRPHKSLANFLRKETPADNIIGSTRFFGPILKPCDIDIKSNNRENSSEDISSMTPDSLEIEAQTYTHQSYMSEDEKNLSYTSHNYIKSKNCNSYGISNKDGYIKYKNVSPVNIERSIKHFDNIKENDIYAQPKSLQDIKLQKKVIDTHNLRSKSNKYIDIQFNEGKISETFVDSLETYDTS